FAGRINIEQQQLIELGQTSRKLIGKITRATEQMRLKNGQNLIVRIQLPGGGTNRIDLRWMMGVIVYVNFFIGPDLKRKTAFDSCETFERFCNSLVFYAKPVRHGKCHHSVT